MRIILSLLYTESNDAVAKPDPLLEDDFFGVNKSFTVRQLFEARVHLGHKAGMWNPLMKKYIYGTRTGMHIFNLDKTAAHLRLALNLAAHIACRRGVILFVNERPHFEGVVQRTAHECGEYYVTNWRGGTLTNSYPLLKTFRLPDLMIFTSVLPSKTAVREANMACIPSIAVVDSDCDPNLILYPVPGNDDTPSSILLYHQLFADVINKAKSLRKLAEEKDDSPKSYSLVKFQTQNDQDS
jgi:small subunit ribosomal protein S2